MERGQRTGRCTSECEASPRHQCGRNARDRVSEGRRQRVTASARTAGSPTGCHVRGPSPTAASALPWAASRPGSPGSLMCLREAEPQGLTRSHCAHVTDSTLKNGDPELKRWPSAGHRPGLPRVLSVPGPPKGRAHGGHSDAWGCLEEFH